MSLRRRRLAVTFRLALVISVLAGIALTALGPATVTGLLPYFTIQSNVAVGVLAGYAAWCALRDRPEPPSALKGAVTLYITITGTVYHLVLANPASPFAMAQPDRQPGEWWGNQFLHTVVPLLAVADWALFDRRGRLRPRYAAWWLVFPLGYLGFALVRGLIVGEVQALRKAYQLPESQAWPMATFTLVVHHLLTSEVARQENFKGFCAEDIRQALLATGYLRLEFVRARMRVPDNLRSQLALEAA